MTFLLREPPEAEKAVRKKGESLPENPRDRRPSALRVIECFVHKTRN